MICPCDSGLAANRSPLSGAKIVKVTQVWPITVPNFLAQWFVQGVNTWPRLSQSELIPKKRLYRPVPLGYQLGWSQPRALRSPGFWMEEVEFRDGEGGSDYWLCLRPAPPLSCRSTRTNYVCYMKNFPLFLKLIWVGHLLPEVKIIMIRYYTQVNVTLSKRLVQMDRESLFRDSNQGQRYLRL